MVYGESKSNGHVKDDVMWPWKVKLMTPKCLQSISWKQLEMLF